MHTPSPSSIIPYAFRLTNYSAEPSGGATGQASDIALHAKEILRIRNQLTDIYASHCKRPDEETGKARDRFETALERDYYMTAEEAVEFGMLDKIVEKRVAVDGKDAEKAQQ